MSRSLGSCPRARAFLTASISEALSFFRSLALEPFRILNWPGCECALSLSSSDMAGLEPCAECAGLDIGPSDPGVLQGPPPGVDHGSALGIARGTSVAGCGPSGIGLGRVTPVGGGGPAAEELAVEVVVVPWFQTAGGQTLSSGPVLVSEFAQPLDWFC